MPIQSHVRAYASSYHKGVAVEAYARQVLEDSDYSILAHRYKSRSGEIDFVAKKGSHLAFVEVKGRKTHDEAAYAITHRQQMRIADAASLFLAEHEEYSTFSASFDVMLVSPHEGCHHLENAFLA